MPTALRRVKRGTTKAMPIALRREKRNPIKAMLITSDREKRELQKPSSFHPGEKNGALQKHVNSIRERIWDQYKSRADLVRGESKSTTTAMLILLGRGKRCITKVMPIPSRREKRKIQKLCRFHPSEKKIQYKSKTNFIQDRKRNTTKDMKIPSVRVKRNIMKAMPILSRRE